MVLDSFAYQERKGLLLPKPEFSLTQEDLINISKVPGDILSRLINEPNIVVGHTWSYCALEEFRRNSGEWIRTIILEPRRRESVGQELRNIFTREYELISDGIDSFTPTYPLEELGLVVRRLAEWAEPPEGKTLRELRSSFFQELNLKGWGVRDPDNNLIYTKHGFCIIDVLDCTSI